MIQATKVLVVSTVLPYPVDSGKKVVLSGFIDYFTARTGTEIEYFLIGDNCALPPGSPDLKIIVARKPSLARRLLNLLLFSVLLRRKSFQEAMVYSPRIGKAIRSQINSFNPDLVLADTVRAGQYLAGSGLQNKVLYLEDLFSVRYIRTLQSLAQFPNSQIDVLGRFSIFVPGMLRKLLAVNSLRRLALRVEASLVAASEDRQARQFSKNLLLNRQEVELLKRRAGTAEVHELTPLLRRSDRVIARSFVGDPSFAFVGGLNYAPNSDGICNFLKEVVPQIRNRIPGFRLRIIGRYAPPELVKLAAENASCVSLEGFLPDLSELYAQVAGVIVPLRFGSGVKLKVLEALMSGVPVVSTKVGIEGIPVISGAHCLIAESAQQFCESISRLLDPEFNARISRASLEFFEQNYSRRAVCSSYDRVFGLSSDEVTTAATSPSSNRQEVSIGIKQA